MDTKLREIVQIVDKNRHFIMFVFNSGVRELYDVTGHENINDLEEVKSLGKLAARDYNGNHPNPPPMTMDEKPAHVCQLCGIDKNDTEKQRAINEAKELELIQREKELDEEINALRKKN